MDQNSEKNVVDVALICPVLAGGLGSVTITLAETMRKRGLYTEIWVLTQSQHDMLNTQIPVNIISAKRASFSLLNLIKMLNSRRPRKILSASYHLNCVVILARLVSKIKPYLVIAEHTSLSTGLETISWHKRLVAKLAIATLYRFADAFVAVSNDAARQMEKYGNLPKNTVATIYNPIINDDLYKASREKFTHPFFKINEPLFLSVGRISKEKDYQTLIAAFAKTNQITPSRLIIAGDGPEMGMLKKNIKDRELSDRVSLLGHISNPYPLYRYADVFVLSSKREGLPTVLIEALALGCRIVSTDARSGPREILQGGTYGKLVSIMDVDALSSAMIDSAKCSKKNIAPNEELVKYGVNSAVDCYVKLLDL